jgi:hypothetical protein
MKRIEKAPGLASLSSEYLSRFELLAIQALQNPERVPFTIRIASGESDLRKAVAIRRAAYGRHLPEFAQSMAVEACDSTPGTTVLLAESKLDGAPIGTMRIQTNEYAPLPVEKSVKLPHRFNGARLGEATRLGVANGAIGKVVKMMLFKSLFLYCEQQQIDWLVITARSPIDREYDAMLFNDVFEDRQFLPMAHVGGLPHRVMAGEVGVARQRWGEAKHPLFKFIFQIHHPDIDLRVPNDLSLKPEPVRCQEGSRIA